MMAISSSMGVTAAGEVMFSSAFRPVRMKPAWSATPMPSMASSTTPKGWKPTKVPTMSDIKAAS